jgi:5'-3' exonuclease
MKTDKAKTSVKAKTKSAKQVVKKQLEISITNKFLEALKGLGHDADKFSKDIKKTSKELAKKLAKKYNEVKDAVEEKLDSKSKAIKIKKIKRPISLSAKPSHITTKKAVTVKKKAVVKNTPELLKPKVTNRSSAVVKKTTKSQVNSKVPTVKPATVKTAPAPAKKISAAKPAVKKVKSAVVPAPVNSVKIDETTSN